MCIAIAKPKDIIIPTSYLESCFENNPDGAGFAYADNDQLIIEKGFMTFDTFKEAFKDHKEKAAIIHFRITTHGDTDEHNTHPFQVGKNMAMIHNGIINAIDRKDDMSRSDTYHFNTKILSQLYKKDSRFIYKDHFKELIKHYIGYSKLVFINNKGHFEIVNEQAGTWDEGVWYSNTSYKPRSFLVPKKSQASNSYSCHTGTKKETSAPTVLTQGCRVYINMHNKTGTGTIVHFTGGMMVGVLVDGEEQTSILPMAALTPIEDLPNDNGYGNPFQETDWVIRVDHEDKSIYEVVGTSKESVWIQKLGDTYQPEGSVYVVNHKRLTTYEDWSAI